MDGQASEQSIEPGRTNLEALFSYILQVARGPGTVYLFTDGWENEGRVERLFRSLSSSPIKVFPFLPAARPARSNVKIKKILSPHRGESGQRISLKVLVENQDAEEVSGKILLKRNGKLFRTDPVKLRPGSHLLSYPATLPDTRFSSFEASFIPDSNSSDLFTRDNRGKAWIAIQKKQKALILNGQREQGTTLQEILRRRGLEVTSLDSGEVPPPPQGYRLVVFNNAPREGFSADYLAEIERYVAAGGSFVMLGAQNSFGPGGFRENSRGEVVARETQ